MEGDPDGKLTERSTRLLQVHPAAPEAEFVAEAGACLRDGGLVAFPTETVYGLGANALLPAAVRAIFAAKGRPADNPLIVHVPDAPGAAALVATWPAAAADLARRFWPGPLTLVLPRRAHVPDEVTAGLPTVAVRVPAHPVALALLSAAKVPVAAPSANRSGRPSPTLAEHVVEDLWGRIDVVLDGGSAGLGVESTVLDLSVDPPAVLRPGGVTVEALQRALGHVAVHPAATAAGEMEGPVRSPGMKYAHYAPRAPVILVEGEPASVVRRIQELTALHRSAGQRVGILGTLEHAGLYAADTLQVAGSRKDVASIAGNIYRCLRAFDRAGADLILVEGVEPVGLGLAVMNRLRRAAGGRIERV